MRIAECGLKKQRTHNDHSLYSLGRGKKKANYRLQTIDSRLQTSDLRLKDGREKTVPLGLGRGKKLKKSQVASCKSQVTGPLQTTDIGLQISDTRLPTENLKTSNWKLLFQTLDFRLRTLDIRQQTLDSSDGRKERKIIWLRNEKWKVVSPKSQVSGKADTAFCNHYKIPR